MDLTALRLERLRAARAAEARGPVCAGIVNVTPDSFSDGGLYAHVDAAVAHGISLVAEGATWLDVGGESTRPGAQAVLVEEELARVEPVIRGLRDALPGVVISIDTRKARVADAALAAGADVVNDVSAGEDPEMWSVVTAHRAGVVLMHMRGTPETMQGDTHYDDLVQEVHAFLSARARCAIEEGVPPEFVWLDPGLGFGKSLEDNARLVAALPDLLSRGFPVMLGASRKRFIGALTGVSAASERVFGSVGAALAGAQLGVQVLRVHDVAATIQALVVYRACLHG